VPILKIPGGKELGRICPFLEFLERNYESFLKMVKKTIYFGRFISTPTPTEPLIRSGAVLVAGEDGSGVIEEVDWEVKDPEEAKRKFGMVDVVTTGNDDGFFFPGFIGMAHLSGACVVVEITVKSP
jgi:hypothetical protein